jgi:hypothetical protein
VTTEDRVWHAVSEGLLGRSQKQARTGFTNICCPMCVLRGETPDRKHRCGVTHDGLTTGVNCFNCGFRARYQPGEHLSRNMRDFLEALGTSRRDMGRLVLWAEQMRRHPPDLVVAQAPTTIDQHPTANLPHGARPLSDWADEGCRDPWFCRVARYLCSRGAVAMAASTYYWTPSTFRDLNRYLLIPCHQDQRVVGWTARAVDPALTRYLKSLPPNYLFNAQFLTWPHRQYVFIVEGVFDGLTIDGVASLRSTLNDKQIDWINRCGKQPVVVPDRDKAGSHLVEIAIQQHWAVATPCFGRHQWWDADVKDAAEAVCRYNKLYTVQSILATQVTYAPEILARTSYKATSMR